jgi:hypothetical protein
MMLASSTACCQRRKVRCRPANDDGKQQCPNCAQLGRYCEFLTVAPDLRVNTIPTTHDRPSTTTTPGAFPAAHISYNWSGAAKSNMHEPVALTGGQAATRLLHIWPRTCTGNLSPQAQSIQAIGTSVGFVTSGGTHGSKAAKSFAYNLVHDFAQIQETGRTVKSQNAERIYGCSLSAAQ